MAEHVEMLQQPLKAALLIFLAFSALPLLQKLAEFRRTRGSLILGIHDKTFQLMFVEFSHLQRLGPVLAFLGKASLDNVCRLSMSFPWTDNHFVTFNSLPQPVVRKLA